MDKVNDGERFQFFDQVLDRITSKSRLNQLKNERMDEITEDIRTLEEWLYSRCAFVQAEVSIDNALETFKLEWSPDAKKNWKLRVTDINGTVPLDQTKASVRLQCAAYLTALVDRIEHKIFTVTKKKVKKS